MRTYPARCQNFGTHWTQDRTFQMTVLRTGILLLPLLWIGCGGGTDTSPAGDTTDTATDVADIATDTTTVISCADEPCMHFGTCVPTPDGFDCECTPGYDGDLCENNIDDCLEEPCVNGTCFDEVDAYLCDCEPGYQGETCDEKVLSCEDLICENGDCVEDDEAFICVCHAGYEGDACSQEINECLDVTCENEGVCVDGIPIAKATQCLTAQDTGGCDGFAGCATAVCALDPYCCEEVWDATCASCAQGSPGYDGLDCSSVGNACIGKVGFECDCPTGVFGELCEYALGDCLDAECLYASDYDILTEGVSQIDSGFSIPSALVVYGEDSFPVVVDEIGSVIVAAGAVSNGRVVAFGHESHLLGGILNDSDLRQLALNSVKWASSTENPTVGVTPEFPGFLSLLEEEGFNAITVTLDNLDNVDVVIAHATLDRTDIEIATVHEFTENGGGMVLAGQAWYWSYSHENVAELYPGNQLLEQAGIRWTPAGDTQGELDTVPDSPPSVLHHARYALPQYLLAKTGENRISQLVIAISLWPLRTCPFPIVAITIPPWIMRIW